MAVIVSLITFLFPLFFFPAVTAPVFGAKNYFLAVGVFLLLIFAGFRLVQKEKVKYSVSSLDFLVILFLLANILSWYFLPRGVKADSLVQPLGLGTIIVLSLLYFVISQSKLRKKFQGLFYGLISSGVILSLLSIVLFILPEGYSAGWVRYFNFLTFANPFILAQFLVLVSVFVVSQIIKEINKEGELQRWWTAVTAVIILVGAGVTIYRAVQAQPAMPDWFSSWATTVEAFKRKPLLGVGPNNYSTAFTRFRPREFNQTDNWNRRFGISHSWFLQVWAELGLVGLVILILMFVKSLSLIKNKPSLRFLIPAIWAILIFFPGNLITLFLLFLGLGLIRPKGNQKEFNLIIGEKDQNGAPYLVGGLLIILGLVGGYYTYMVFMPELTFYRAVKAASENKGGETYDLQRKAINQNSFRQDYRISFSQTNLALAKNIIRQVQGQEQELTEERRQQLQQLIAQAVNEAKAAVALEPQNVVGWENLAQIYRQLINTAQNAEQWTISAYQQAIALDSLNPRLRVDYGGVLFGLGQYEESAKQFEIAVNLKNDYANAWYNWAYALKEQDKLQPAVERLQQAVNLVDRDTNDYQKVSQELEQWREELNEEEQPVEVEEPTEGITTPEPIPSPELDEPIILPEDAAPELDEGTTVPEEEEIQVEETPTKSSPSPTPSEQTSTTEE